MKTERVFITVEDALSLIGTRKEVHTFRNPGPNIMIGADHSKQSITKTIKDAHKLEIGGDMCKNMGHGLVIWENESERPLFVEVDKVELQALEDKILQSA